MPPPQTTAQKQKNKRKSHSERERRCLLSVDLKQLDFKHEVRIRGDLFSGAGSAVAQLRGNAQATLLTHAHAVQSYARQHPPTNREKKKRKKKERGNQSRKIRSQTAACEVILISVFSSHSPAPTLQQEKRDGHSPWSHPLITADKHTSDICHLTRAFCLTLSASERKVKRLVAVKAEETKKS
jgi:hypothetical protein